MIKIYHVPRSRSLRVVWLMEELGEPYEIERIDFPPDSAFREKNPEGTLPFIEDNGIAMAESIAILQYITGMRLASRPPAPTFTVGPRPDPKAYAEHLQLLHLGEASLATPLTMIFATGRFGPEGGKENFTTQLCADIFARRLKPVEIRLADGRTYVTGKDFTIADISVGYALGVAEALGLGGRIPGHSRAYYKRLTERPAYQRAVAK
ncbi:MAG TPA: glutathione S-transferase family protein [Alphaproteobacteria bacterium]|nr:glutathione S-transferase family protein [Alphaproteobacteria bacterium]